MLFRSTPVGHVDDGGVMVECNDAAHRRINVPISPGLHREVGIESTRKLTLEEVVQFNGPGILAFDGDRTLKLAEGESATALIRRDGPRIIEAERVMTQAAASKLFEYTHK